VEQGCMSAEALYPLQNLSAYSSFAGHLCPAFMSNFFEDGIARRPVPNIETNRCIAVLLNLRTKKTLNNHC
jgi:hypothetical protein